MIYFRGLKGNYLVLDKFTKMSTIFSDVDNKRRMLHIDTLSKYIRLMIKDEEEGT